MAEFTDREDLKRWLQDKPREWAVVLAARAALRVVPLLAAEFGGKRKRSGLEVARNIVLPVLRGTAAPWVAGVWPARGADIRVAASAAADGCAVAAPASASDAAYAAYSSFAASASAATADAVIFAADAADAAAIFATAAAADVWAAVSADATELEGQPLPSMGPEGLALQALWPHPVPDWAGKNLSRLKRALLQTNEDWDVWTDWYENRLYGTGLSIESLEVARVLIDEDIWKQGPKAVNAHIRELIEEFKPKPRLEHSLAFNDRNPPRISDEIRKGADDLILPPTVPLPVPSPATRFAYVGDKFDVIAPTAWQNREGQAGNYHKRAIELAAQLAERLSRTDALPDVAGSITALLDVLGDHAGSVQPDQLRLASRSISAKARAFGHPSAEFEISAESVSALFELSDVLVDYQSIVRSELEDHERAIRQLDLNPENVAEAKEALDVLAEGIIASGLASEQVEIAFSAAAQVSDTATTSQVKVAIEGDRILLAENFALAVGRELNRNDSIGVGTTPEGGGPPDKLPPPPSEEPDKPGRKKRPARRSLRRSSQRSWEDFSDRVIERIHEKGPEKIADAALEAAASTIRHAPKTVLGIGSALLLWSAAYPILASGAAATTLAWIAYEVWRRSKTKK